MGLASHPAAEESDRTGKAPHARAIYANGREVNEPSDAHFLAGGNQGGHAFVMNACC
jgi:hypothetical protein